MQRLVSTALAVVLLLGLGALAVLARGGGAILSPADDVVAAAAPDAPAAIGPKYNAIALPIDGGYDLASELAAHIQASTGNTVYQLLKWDPNQGTEGAFEVYEPGSLVSDDFDLFVGDALFALLSGRGTVLSLVGDVPPEQSVTFPLVGDPAGCHYNFISVPLDMDGITKAAALANDIGDVVQVLSWDPALGEEGLMLSMSLGTQSVWISM